MSKPTPSPQIVTYADLFCGLGAFHTAFDRESTDAVTYQCVWACDLDPGVRRLYQKNYGLPPEGDINAVDLATLPHFDILCAGFPCQPFSIAGKKEGFAAPDKGNLFYRILEVIDHCQPETLLLENVKNLETIHDGSTFQTIMDQLQERGYKMAAKVLDSAHYGSPQSRHRVYLVGQKSTLYQFRDIRLTPVAVSQILDHTVDQWLDYQEKYGLEACHGGGMMKFRLINLATGKGGRQGERVYGTETCGPTICASSGGPGAKTGLYLVDGRIRRLSVGETLQMFGFPPDYRYQTGSVSISKEKMLFYLGNSIVVPVLQHLIRDLERPL